jgi:glycosyltransferase involved in cell wall biosynthesis
MAKTYLLAVQAPAYPIGPDRFATEGAFAEHLKAIRRHLAPTFDRVLLVGPALSRAAYEANRTQLVDINSGADGIGFLPIHTVGGSTLDFWRNVVPLWRSLRREVRNSAFVHTAPSPDTWRPFLALLNLAARIEGKPTVFFVDIDFRQNSRRYYALGEWSWKSYIVNRSFHDVFKSAQISFAVRNCDLVLLKSTSMVADFGRGRSHVKFFLDAAHDDTAVIGAADLEAKLVQRSDPHGGRELRVIYFGRLVRYKGLDFIIEAIATARRRGARVVLTIVGDGAERDALIAVSRSQGIEDAVTFLPAVPYGPQLFDLIDLADLAIAAPRVEDTPRAALDAMARGLPVLAFDIEYFRSLRDLSGAVELAAWPDPSSLAEQLIALDRDRARIAEMSRRAVAFARDNTQRIWLQRRIEWTNAALSGHNHHAPVQVPIEAAPPPARP